MQHAKNNAQVVAITQNHHLSVAIYYDNLTHNNFGCMLLNILMLHFVLT